MFKRKQAPEPPTSKPGAIQVQNSPNQPPLPPKAQTLSHAENESIQASEVNIKSVGASISSPNEKPQQARLVDPIDSDGLSPEPNEQNKGSEVIMKRIERNPDARRENKATDMTISTSGPAIQRVERKSIIPRKAVVVDTSGSKRNSVVVDPTSLPKPHPESNKLESATSPGPKVRFEMDQPESPVKSAVMKSPTESQPVGILRKSGANQENGSLDVLAENSNDPNVRLPPKPPARRNTKLEAHQVADSVAKPLNTAPTTQKKLAKAPKIDAVTSSTIPIDPFGGSDMANSPSQIESLDSSANTNPAIELASDSDTAGFISKLQKPITKKDSNFKKESAGAESSDLAATAISPIVDEVLDADEVAISPKSSKPVGKKEAKSEKSKNQPIAQTGSGSNTKGNSPDLLKKQNKTSIVDLKGPESKNSLVKISKKKLVAIDGPGSNTDVSIPVIENGAISATGVQPLEQAKPTVDSSKINKPNPIKASKIKGDIATNGRGPNVENPAPKKTSDDKTDADIDKQLKKNNTALKGPKALKDTVPNANRESNTAAKSGNPDKSEQGENADEKPAAKKSKPVLETDKLIPKTGKSEASKKNDATTKSGKTTKADSAAQKAPSTKSLKITEEAPLLTDKQKPMDKPNGGLKSSIKNSADSKKALKKSDDKIASKPDNQKSSTEVTLNADTSLKIKKNTTSAVGRSKSVPPSKSKTATQSASSEITKPEDKLSKKNNSKESVKNGSKDALAKAVGTTPRQKSLSEPPPKPGKLLKLLPNEKSKSVTIDDVKNSTNNLSSGSTNKLGEKASGSNAASKENLEKAAKKTVSIKGQSNEDEGLKSGKAKQKSRRNPTSVQPSKDSKDETGEPKTSKEISKNVIKSNEELEKSEEKESRLERTLKLRAKLKMDVDGFFAMGLFSPTESELNPPTNISIENISIPELDPEVPEAVQKSIPNISSPLPIKRNASTRRAVIKNVGYPATGWPDESDTEIAQDQEHRFTFRRSNSVDDVLTSYQNFRKDHPLPFGHYENYHDVWALKNEKKDLLAKYATLNDHESTTHQDYNGGIVGYSELDITNDPTKRPTTVPISGPKALNSVSRKPQSANAIPIELKMPMHVPTGYPPIGRLPASLLGANPQPAQNMSENSVKYLQQYMDRVKKAGREPPMLVLPQTIVQPTLPLLDPVSKPKRQAPLPSRKKSLKDAARGRSQKAGIHVNEDHPDSQDWERYSDIVQRRNEETLQINSQDEFDRDEDERRGRSRSRRRFNTPAGNDTAGDFSPPRIRSAEREAIISAMTEANHRRVMDDPFGLPSPRLDSAEESSRSTKQFIKKRKESTVVMKKQKSSKDSFKTQEKPLKKIEFGTTANNSIFQASLPFNPWAIFFPHLPQYFNSDQNIGQVQPSQQVLRQQLLESHFPWMFPSNQAVQSNNQELSEPILGASKSTSKSTNALTKVKKIAAAESTNRKLPVKQVTAAKNATSKTKEKPTAQQPIASIAAPPTDLQSQTQQGTFSSIQNPGMMPLLIPSTRAFVPPGLMPARVRVQNVPVITMQQAMVIEPTGEAPGFLGDANILGGIPQHSTFLLTNGFSSGVPMPGLGTDAATGDTIGYSDVVVKEQDALEREVKDDKKEKNAATTRTRVGVRSLIRTGVIGRRQKI